MTDLQTYTDALEGSKLRLRRSEVRADADKLFLSVVEPGSAPANTYIPAAELLAMIDRADPDAMRAYLRETAPEVIADLYRPAPAAADHFDYLDAVPEADSPEDVDERPVITVTPEALDAAEQLGRYVAEIRDAFTRGIAR